MTTDSNLQGVKNIALFYLNSLEWALHADSNKIVYAANKVVNTVTFIYVLSHTNKSGSHLTVDVTATEKIATGKIGISGVPLYNHNRYSLSRLQIADKETTKALYLKVHEEHQEKQAANFIRLMNKDQLR